MNKIRLYFSLSLIFLLSFSTVNADSYGKSHFDKKIVVTGNGKMTTDPNYAVYKINFKVTDDDIAIVKLKHQKLQDKVMTAIKNLGVDEKDILINLKAEILPANSGYNSPTEQKFSLSKRIFITLHDLKNIEKLTVALVEYKNVKFENLEYRVNDVEKLKSESLKRAIENAKKAAGQLSAQTGLVLGNISGVNLLHQNTSANIHYGSTYYAPASQASEILIAPGKLFVSTSVNVAFDVSQSNKLQATTKAAKTPATDKNIAAPVPKNTQPVVIPTP